MSRYHMIAFTLLPRFDMLSLFHADFFARHERSCCLCAAISLMPSCHLAFAAAAMLRYDAASSLLMLIAADAAPTYRCRCYHYAI